ncbi:site-specific DNA-methyltransferase [Spiroplasma sp. SV19]|nr:site-specific DNA-methyltransferase [Spiroplasma sp. SV19]
MRCKMNNFILEVGNCLDMIKDLDSNSIDIICTDPPYEIGMMNKKWDKTKIVFNIATWIEMLRVLKPGGILLVFGHPTKYHRVACAIEDAGFILRDTISWVYGSGFPKAQDVSMIIDKKIAQVPHRGRETSFASKFKYNGKMLKKGINIQEYEPITELAKKWKGWKTLNLKPAYEPIILAQKPLDKNYANNLLKWGIGAMNIDDNRISYGNETPVIGGRTGQRTEGYGYKNLDAINPNLKGRFPSNFIHDGSEDVLKLFPNTKSGYMNSNIHNITMSGSKIGIYGKYNINNNIETIGDSGSASRFFYCAKASLIDREEGLEKSDGLNKRKNTHITVKPMKLMTHLISLFAPKNAIILDPFLGSGSTGKAVAFINRIKDMNYSFIGYELSEEYFTIASKRIEYVMNYQINKESELKNLALRNIEQKSYTQLALESVLNED